MKKKVLLIGNGYWGNIIKTKLYKLSTLVDVIDSKKDIDVELSTHKDIDFVFICTPTSTHYDIVRKCILKKLNIFCEKPFTGDFNKSIELYDLADKNGVKIYVDNLFLKRLEILPHISNHKNSIFFKFEWYKYDEKIKENLIHSLLYHDIYLLIEMTNCNWVLDDVFVNDETLFLKMVNGTKISTFHYDRKNKNNKLKKITIDNTSIDLTSPKNDPIYEIIDSLLNGDVDFEDNRRVVFNTLKIIKKISDFLSEIETLK